MVPAPASMPDKEISIFSGTLYLLVVTLHFDDLQYIHMNGLVQIW